VSNHVAAWRRLPLTHVESGGSIRTHEARLRGLLSPGNSSIRDRNFSSFPNLKSAKYKSGNRFAKS
jgi:hypothetical protein